MSPIERVRARAAALRELGVDHHASPEDIRQAWKRIAFQAHPDHGGGDNENFARAKAAYDLLRTEGRSNPARRHAARNTNVPRRPKIMTRVVEFSDDELALCEDVLASGANDKDGVALTYTGGVSDQGLTSLPPDVPPTCHIPASVFCQGRNMTYCVLSPLVPGINRIALPTSVLTSNRGAGAKCLTIHSYAAGAADIMIPDTVRMRMFPGSNSIRLRFLDDDAEFAPQSAPA